MLFDLSQKYYCDIVNVQIKLSKKKGKEKIEKDLKKHLKEINHDYEEYNYFIDNIKNLTNIEPVCFFNLLNYIYTLVLKKKYCHSKILFFHLTISLSFLEFAELIYNHIQSYTIIYNHIQSYTIIYNLISLDQS